MEEAKGCCSLQRPKNEKKRGSKRSSAGGGMKLSTDPQSVAARERRHRISERFKILQSMVPGGTKMDTVSMLEEAIHYVKFLKTQIWLHQAAATATAATSSSSVPPGCPLPTQMQLVNEDCCSLFPSYDQLLPPPPSSATPPTFYVKVEREEQQQPPNFYL